MNSELQSTIIEPPAASGSFVFPVTFAQQRLWFLDQLHPGDTSYLIPWNIRLTGELNVNALCAALSEIVARHETLRTTFALVDGEVSQVIAEQLVVPVPVTDLSGRADPPAEADRLAAEEAHKPLDMANGPLVRAQLLRLSRTDHVFLVTLHHIVFDRWSRGILTRELGALYSAFLERKPSPLAPLALQYADYAVWQREYLQGDVLDEQLGYWKNRLAGAPAELGLPTDRPRPAVMTFRGADLSFRFPESLSRKLNEFAQGHGATLFMTLLAGFQALLSRYTGLDDVMVGTPIFNRNRTELESIIGFFANTLALRLDLSGDPSFAELVQRAKNVALGAYEHQDLPFDRIVQEVNPERSLSLNPLIQVLFSLGNVPRHAFELPGLDVHLGGKSDKTAKFDLSIILRPQGEKLSGVIEYSTDLFDESTIVRMLGHFENLLTGAVENPARRLSELPLMGAEERKQVLFGFNETAQEYPRGECMHQLLSREGLLAPNRTAVIDGKKSLTWAALIARSNRLAHGLIRMGAGPDVLVGIRMPRGADMLVGLLGILKAGAAYVPLDPSFPQDRIEYILQDSAASIVVTDEMFSEAGWKQFADLPTRDPITNVTPDNLAYVLHTSGSTGRPKGVQITHRNLLNFLTGMLREPGFSRNDVLLAVTTISFDIAGLELYLPLLAGGQVAIASRDEAIDGAQLAGLIERHGVTVLQATPATWRMLIQAGWKGTPRLKALCGGEAMPPELAEQLLPRVAELWNMYGPTETTIWSSVYRVRTVPAGAVPLGKPIANTTMYVLSAGLQPVPVGVAGELYIGGDGVARGYLNRADLTAERFLADPFVARARIYKTGDIAKLLPTGDVQYLGRADFQVKVRGFRIELGEIETVLAQHAGVRECVVAAVDERLIGYVIPSGSSGISAGELRVWAKDRLPEYMVPAAFVELAAFPLTPNGKVDRKALPAPAFSREDRPEFIEASTPLEMKLATIWAEVLKLPRVGVNDDFFELGGYSLLAVDLFSRIEKEIGQKLPLGLLFDARTISAIAARMDQTEWQPVETSVKPLRTAGNKPPIYAAYGLGATVLTFRNLSRYLDPDQPIYCLEALGVDSGWNSLKELAAIYVRDMLAFQPQGPYHLMGASFGGMVVYEIARQLQAQGHEVGLVGLLDSYNRGDRNVQPRSERIDKQMGFIKRRVNTHMRRLLTRRPAQWPRYIVGRFLAIGRLTEGALWRVIYRTYRATPKKRPPMLRNLIRVYELAGMDYVPQSYPGKLVLFRSQRKASEEVIARLIRRQHGWIGLAEGGLEIIDVPGDHHTMLQEPHVAVLVREISGWIARYAAEKAGAAGESAGDLNTMAAGRK